MELIKATLTRVTTRILRPLVKVLLRYEISHVEFAEIAKRVYVDVANRHFTIEGRKQTHSRIAVLTGLHRKEVVALLKAPEDEPPQNKTTLNRAARVIGGWMRDAEFLDAPNKPKELPLRGDHGSFEALVARHSGDISPRAILDELLRVGAVEKTATETVKLSHRGYVPQDAPVEKLAVMADCVTDLLSSATHNLDPGDEGTRFQRQVAYANLPEGVIREFKEYSQEKSLELLLDFNRWLAEREANVKAKPNEKTGRVGVGVYYFKHERGED